MKYLLPLLVVFAILGCCATAAPPPAPPLSCSPDKCPLGAYNSVARGSYNQLNWVCSLQELTDGLAWIKCTFTNNSDEQNRAACIEVKYRENETNLLVVWSRATCSGLLNPGNSSEAYAAFAGKERQNLAEVCGPRMRSCFMSATTM
jgi:hypothetical protein